jgi:hypothetical protein
VDDRLLGSALFDPVRSVPGFEDRLAVIRAEARARVVEMRSQLPSPL